MPSNEILQPEEHVPPAEAPHPPLPFALRWLTWLFVLPLLALATAFFGSISLIVGLWDSSGRQQHYIARTTSQFSSSRAQTPDEVATVIVDLLLAERPAARVQTSAFASAFVGTNPADLAGSAVQNLTAGWVTAPAD